MRKRKAVIAMDLSIENPPASASASATALQPRPNPPAKRLRTRPSRQSDKDKLSAGFCKVQEEERGGGGEGGGRGVGEGEGKVVNPPGSETASPTPVPYSLPPEIWRTIGQMVNASCPPPIYAISMTRHTERIPCYRFLTHKL